MSHLDAKKDLKELVDGLQGSVGRVNRSLVYLLAALVVTLAMVALPAVYFALLAFVGHSVFEHIQTAPELWRGAGSTWNKLAAIAGPSVVGIIVFLFLVKPISARGRKSSSSVGLDPATQPLLFALVEQLSPIVGAPKPQEIRVDCSTNASASFRHGILGILRGHLVLTLGLPLVGGLSVGQLSGVIAHELGHFTQGAGMRLSYIIRSINSWFARLVYERDTFDTALRRALSLPMPLVVRVFLLSAALLIWLSRGVLWVLMMAGHVMSSFLLRKMEFDADRYEIYVSGSDAFESTTIALAQLQVAEQEVHRNLVRQWLEGRPASDIPMSIARRVAKLSSKKKRQIQSDVLSEKTGVFDTHPAAHERIARAETQQCPGILVSDRSATDLVTGFAELSVQGTSAFFQSLLGPAAVSKGQRSNEDTA